MLITLLFAPLLALAQDFSDQKVEPDIFLIQKNFKSVRLSGAADAELSTYVDGIIKESLVVGEPAPPRIEVRIFEGHETARMALLKHGNPAILYLNARLFQIERSRDADAFVVLNQMRLLSDQSRVIRHAMTGVYDQSITTLLFRLFRMGQIDPKTKAPLAAMVNPQALLDYFETRREAENEGVDPTLMATAVKSAYANEISQREFPEPTPRRKLDRLLAEVGTAKEDKKQEEVVTASLKVAYRELLARAQEWIGKISQNHVADLIQLQQRADLAGSINRDLAIEYGNIMRNFFARLKKAKGLGIAGLHTGPCSKLPLNFFDNWNAVLLANTPYSAGFSSYDLHRLIEVFDLSPALINGDAQNAEKAALDLLRNERLNLNLSFVTMSISRLMREAVDRESIDFSDRPWTSLILAAYLKAAKRTLRFGILPATVKKFDERFGRDLTASLDDPKLVELITQKISEDPDSSFLRSLSIVFGWQGLRTSGRALRTGILAKLPIESHLANLRFALDLSASRAEFARELRKRDPVDFVVWAQDQVSDYGRKVKRWRLDRILLEFIDSAATAEDLEAVTSLDTTVIFKLFAPKFEITTARDFLKFDAHRDKLPAVARWSKRLTEIVVEHRGEFLTQHFAAMERDGALVTLVDWRTVFAQMNANEIRQFITVTRLIESSQAEAIPLRKALLERMKTLIDDSASVSLSLTQLAQDVLNRSAVATAAGQQLVSTLLDRARQDHSPGSAERFLRVLQALRPINFNDTNVLAEMYSEAVERLLAPNGNFAQIPWALVRAELHDVRDRFEPYTATLILNRLARAYRAAPAQREDFSVTESHINPTELSMVPPTLVWRYVTQNLTREQRNQLGQALATPNAPLPPDLILVLKKRFIEAQMKPDAQDPDRAIRTWFQGLTRLRRQDEISQLMTGYGRPLLTKEMAERQVKNQVAHILRAIEGSGELTIPKDQVTDRTYGAPILKLHRETTYDVVEQFEFWKNFSKELDRFEVMNLMNSLRGNTSLGKTVAMKIHFQLIKSNVLLPIEGVEAYLRARFSEMNPLARATLAHLLLDKGTNDRILNDPSFRYSIYRDIAKGLPNASTKSIFLDIWTAGLKHLPKSLHSMILATVLSESGRVGSPEAALVAVLTQRGPLSQKKGQGLALSDIQPSYKTELRKLWNSAQPLAWWKAQELLLNQKGDVSQAGYQLSRILNSGSTMAYLELTHVRSGHRMVVAVEREGIRQAIAVETVQLRGFAADLAARDQARYGFLPVLVEDAIDTIHREIDPVHKAQMNKEMKEAYRRAGVSFGYRITPQGFIDSGRFIFRGVEELKVTLRDGTEIEGQELAEGVPLQDLKTSDPEVYTELVQLVLKLERAALADPNAPIDKDRMPGQYIYHAPSRTLFMLDPGQARVIDRRVRTQLPEILRAGFIVDVKKLDEMLENLTGLAPAAKSSAKQVRRSELAVRPLTYLNGVSQTYLTLDESDGRRQRYMDIVHGVRAHLRLLHWERDEKLRTYADDIETEIRAATPKWRLALDLARRKVGGLWQRFKDWLRTVGNTERVMEAAYSTDGKLRGGAAGICDRLLRPTVYRATRFMDENMN